MCKWKKCPNCSCQKYENCQCPQKDRCKCCKDQFFHNENVWNNVERIALLLVVFCFLVLGIVECVKHNKDVSSAKTTAIECPCCIYSCE